MGERRGSKAAEGAWIRPHQACGVGARGGGVYIWYGRVVHGVFCRRDAACYVRMGANGMYKNSIARSVHVEAYG